MSTASPHHGGHLEPDIVGPAAVVEPDVIEPAVAEVGGIPVRRVLPRARRRTIGAWCFVDQAGPVDAEALTMQVGPHPHIGLHTVSWMIAGELVHHDSLGNEQVLRPGAVNLMTAGAGIAHAELAARHAHGSHQLVQLWVAQPEATRHGAPDFAHHADLPRIGLAGAQITLLLGEFAGVRSPVRADTPLLGAEILLTGPIRLAVGPDPAATGGPTPIPGGFEYGVLPLDADVRVNSVRIPAGSLGYLPAGTAAIEITPTGGTARVMLLGGEPFDEPLQMHWNFVARTRKELRRAVEDWNAGTERFGDRGLVTRTQMAPVLSPPAR